MKRSLSKLIKSEEFPQFSIESFKVEDVTQDRHHVLFEKSSDSKEKPPDANSSVSAWNLPIIEKDDDNSGEREDKETKLARLEKEAYEKGFEQGQKDGLSLEKKKMEEMGRQFEALFTEIADLKAHIYSESEIELLKLSLVIAKKIIGSEVRTNKAIIRNTVQSALKFVADKRKIRISLNPEDMEDVQRFLPELSKLISSGQFQLTEDNAVEKGGCLIETGFGKINATIDDQLGVIGEEIDRLFLENQGALHESLS